MASGEEFVRPGAVGHWSPKDLLLHVAAWDIELITVVDKHRTTGEESDYGTDEEVDRLNEAQVEEKRGLSFDQVWEYLGDAHRRLVDFLTDLPDEAFNPDSFTGDWIATDSYGHYRGHREDLERCAG